MAVVLSRKVRGFVKFCNDWGRQQEQQGFDEVPFFLKQPVRCMKQLPLPPRARLRQPPRCELQEFMPLLLAS